jgi:hypothetical protein
MTRTGEKRRECPKRAVLSRSSTTMLLVSISARSPSRATTGKNTFFALKQAVELYDFYHQEIQACDGEIERHLRTFEAKVDLMQNPLPKQKKRGKKPIGNQSFVDLRTELHRMSGIAFT